MPGMPERTGDRGDAGFLASAGFARRTGLEYPASPGTGQKACTPAEVRHGSRGCCCTDRPASSAAAGFPGVVPQHGSDLGTHAGAAAAGTVHRSWEKAGRRHGEGAGAPVPGTAAAGGKQSAAGRTEHGTAAAKSEKGLFPGIKNLLPGFAGG